MIRYKFQNCNVTTGGSKKLILKYRSFYSVVQVLPNVGYFQNTEKFYDGVVLRFFSSKTIFVTRVL